MHLGEIVIRGQVFASVREAAQHFSVTEDNVRRLAKAGRLDRVGTGHSIGKAFPVSIRGVTYPSAREAAAALGVTPGAIHQALHKDRIDRVGGKRRMRSSRSQPVTIGGVTYPSQRAASVALGFAPEYFYRAFKRRSVTMQQRLLHAAMEKAAQHAEADRKARVKADRRGSDA